MSFIASFERKNEILMKIKMTENLCQTKIRNLLQRTGHEEVVGAE